MLDSTQITFIDLIWLAGLFEGEGSFYANETKTGRGCKVSVEMTDKDVVTRAANIIGSHVLGPYVRKNANSRPTYVTKVSKREGVRRLCETLYPMMGKRRRQQISHVLTTIKDWETT